jgi:hypothetical protein
METVGVIAIALLALACPLGMVGMAVVPWLIARARGQKKDLSISCMPMAGHGEQQSTATQGEASGLREEVARLQREVETLKAQRPAAGGADIAPAPASANGHKVPEKPLARRSGSGPD